MNLSELVQVYGSNNSSGDKTQEKSTKESRPAKKSSSARAWKPKNGGQRVSGANKPPPAMVYPPSVLIPQIPGSYAYDPSYGPHYPPPMFYGPPMMMMYPVPAPSTYVAPAMPLVPDSAANVMIGAGETIPSGPASNMGDTSSLVPVAMAPNFVPATFGPVYGYPYDLAYQYGYTPPHKRPKRSNTGNGSLRKHGPSSSLKPPQSPGSDSAESSSSSAPSASPSDKATKPKKFHCEPCEKGFKTQQHYDAHLTTHVPCSYEGCTYSAVKGALRLHEMLHVNNMFAKLSTPEEIERYREERKKRFPSMAREQEKIAAKELEVRPIASSSSNIDQTSLLTSSSNTPSDPTLQGEPIAISSKTDPISTIDDELETQRANSRGKRKKPICKYWKSGKCNKGDQCAFSHASDTKSSDPSSSNTNTTQARSRRGASLTNQKPGPQTLLSQFLQSEKSKENKLILQCLKFIADNQFLRNSP